MATQKAPKVQVELVGPAVQAYGAWLAAKAAKEAADTAQREAEAILFGQVGAADVATINGTPVLSVVRSVSTSLDRDVLKRLAPKAFEKALTVTPKSPYFLKK